MHRRRLAAALLAGITVAALAAFGLRTADAGTSPPPPGPPPPVLYPTCALGSFDSTVTTDQGPWPTLTVTGSAVPCMDPVSSPWFFAFELRFYKTGGSYLLTRYAFNSFSVPTQFSKSGWQGPDKTICLTYGEGVAKRLGCTRPVQDAATGTWSTVTVPVDDPSLDVPDYGLLPPLVQTPNPNCGHCT
jgi:hypothetical protein